MIIWTLIKDADLDNDSCLKGQKRADTLHSSVHKHQSTTSKESYLILALILQPSTSLPLYRLCTFLVVLSLILSICDTRIPSVQPPPPLGVITGHGCERRIRTHPLCVIILVFCLIQLPS